MIEPEHPAEEREQPAAAIPDEPPSKGGILAALLRSPLVGADLDLTSDRAEGRTPAPGDISDEI